MSAARLVLTNAAVVLPDRVIPAGSVAVEAGRIAAVEPRTYRPGDGVLDLDGRFLLPGIVDLHSDGLEKEVTPRPGGDFDPAFALAHYDRKLAAAGVTTQFHGIYFANRAGFGRSVEHGTLMARAVQTYATAPHRLIDHQVLYRLDLRTPEALEGLLRVLDERRGAGPVLVSLNEHVPGQGQYWDLNALRRQLRGRFIQSMSEAEAAEEVEAEVDRRVRHASETDDLAAETLVRIADEGYRRGLVLASHDDDTPERVDLMYEAGCRIAEFPVTLAAAERARARGMRIAVGAPNAVRGASLSGNTSALDLLARGLADLFVADYHAPSLLAALFRAVALGLRDLAGAARLVTLNPATAVGLADRGAIAPERRADLIAVRVSEGVPLVDLTLAAGLPCFASGAIAAPALAGV